MYIEIIALRHESSREPENTVDIYRWPRELFATRIQLLDTLPRVSTESAPRLTRAQGLRQPTIVRLLLGSVQHPIQVCEATLWCRAPARTQARLVRCESPTATSS